MVPLAMFLKPLIALAVFALIIIPIRLLIERAVSLRVRAVLRRPVSPIVMWGAWAVVMAYVIAYGLLATT